MSSLVSDCFHATQHFGDSSLLVCLSAPVPLYCALFYGPTQSVHSPVDRHLACCRGLAITKKTAMNIRTEASVQTWVSIYQMPRSGIAGSCGECKFNSRRSYWNHIPLALHPCLQPHQHMIMPIFLITAILAGVCRLIWIGSSSAFP